jgi:hypothetical protein
MFISRRHAENTAASLRDTAKEERKNATGLLGKGDVFGSFISRNNASTAEAKARLADEAAGLLGDPGER